MTFLDFSNLAAACTNMVALERLFVDDLKFMLDTVPNWRINQVWTENRARIEVDGQTGECLDELIM